MCGRPFCAQCLAEIMGQKLCGECKLQSVTGVVEQRRQHPLALLSLVVPIAGYVTCVGIPFTSGLGIYLGWKVMREIREKPHLSGHSVALAGIVVSGGVLATWLVALVASLILYITSR